MTTFSKIILLNALFFSNLAMAIDFENRPINPEQWSDQVECHIEAHFANAEGRTLGRFGSPMEGFHYPLVKSESPLLGEEKLIVETQKLDMGQNNFFVFRITFTPENEVYIDDELSHVQASQLYITAHVERHNADGSLTVLAAGSEIGESRIGGQAVSAMVDMENTEIMTFELNNPNMSQVEAVKKGLLRIDTAIAPNIMCVVRKK